LTTAGLVSQRQGMSGQRLVRQIDQTDFGNGAY